MNYRVTNIGIAVGLAALAAILTSVYVVNYKRHVQHGEGKVTVLVAAKDIPAGTSGAEVIDQKLLKEQTVPRKAVVAGAISTPDQLSQYVATQDIYEGEQVSTRRFAPPKEQGIRSLIKGTQRAYEVSGDGHQLLAGTLKAGDFVDVVGVWNDPDSDTHHVSRVIIRNALVLKAADGGATAGKVTSPSSDTTSVQLRLTDAQTQKLQWVEEVGAFHLTLRAPNNSLDSKNTFQDSHIMLFDGPGRRP
jgi:Flp pilus assembly protein CpaB